MLQRTTDFEAVLGELSALSIGVEHEPAIQSQNFVSDSASSGFWAQREGDVAQTYLSSARLRQLDSSSPPLSGTRSSQSRYPLYSERLSHGTVLTRPPSQPIGQPIGFPHTQRSWSPAYVPSRPATTIGLPGILGEGIYKVSRVGTASSGRPRVRRTSTILEHQVPKLYTVSKHFDKSLGAGDIISTSRSHYPGRRSSSGLPSDVAASGQSRFPGLDPSKVRTLHTPGHADAIALRQLARNSSTREGVSTAAGHRDRLRRLRTIDDASDPEMSTGCGDMGYRPSPTGFHEGRVVSAFSQTEMDHRIAMPLDNASIPSSSPTLLEMPARQDIEDEWLLRISRIQQEGLLEASKIWDDLMERASTEIVSMDSPGAAAGILLAKYEGEFVRRWGAVLAATAQKMRESRVESYVF